MARTKVLELSLEKVQIDKGRTERKGDTRRLVIATLVWPRARIADCVSVKNLDFQDNAVDLTKAAWTEKIVFKEQVLGPFGLKIGVTEHVSESQAAEFLPFLGSSLFKLVGAEAKKMMLTSFEGSLLKLPFEYLAKIIAVSGSKAPKVHNSGIVDLDPTKAFAKKSGTRVKILLKALKPIYRMTKPRRGGGARSKRRRIVDAGEINGSVVVSGRLY